MSSAGASSPGLSGLEGYASASVPRQTSSDRAKVSTDTHSLMVPCICTPGGESRRQRPPRRRSSADAPSAPSPATPSPSPCPTSHIPRPIAMPMSPPSRYSRRRLQRRERLRARRGACARGSGLPSAGLRASPGCFKSSPAGRRGLGRSRLGSPGPLLSPPFPPQTSARALPQEGPARRHRGGGRPRRPGREGEGEKKARKHLRRFIRRVGASRNATSVLQSHAY